MRQFPDAVGKISNLCDGVAPIASRDKNTVVAVFAQKLCFLQRSATTCFLEGGGTAITMPDGRERDETIMEARLRLENQHLRLGQHDRTTAFSVNYHILAAGILSKTSESQLLTRNFVYLERNLLVCKPPDRFLTNSIYLYRYSILVDSSKENDLRSKKTKILPNTLQNATTIAFY